MITLTEALKLNVTYYARYGGDIDETLILPIETNGVLFEKLEVGTTMDEAVWLGEIEGKHSECYGDLKVDVVDLSELDAVDASNLIESSDYYRFESFFEKLEIEFGGARDKNKVDELMSEYGLEKESYELDTSRIHSNFIDEMKEKYKLNLKAINVSEADYQKALELLSEHGIEVLDK